MAFKMVNGDNRLADGKCQRIGKARTSQQCAAQARALRKGNRVNVGIAYACFLQATLRQRHDTADMITTGQFGDNAAVFGVHRHLCVQMMRQQAALSIVERNAGFRRKMIQFLIPTWFEAV